MDSHMQEIVEKVRQDIIEYEKEHGMSDGAMGKLVGVFQGQISKWRKGDSRPMPKSIERLIQAGITDVKLPELIQQRAITTILENVDSGNKVPRAYSKRVSVLPIISNQVKLLLDDYMWQLQEPKTYAQFQEAQQEFIRKVYYLCRQG